MKIRKSRQRQRLCGCHSSFYDFEYFDSSPPRRAPLYFFPGRLLTGFAQPLPYVFCLCPRATARARRMPNAEKRDLYNCYQNECDKGVSLPRAFKLDHLKPGKLILFQKISTFFILILGARAPISYHPRERKQQEQRMEKRDSPKSG